LLNGSRLIFSALKCQRFSCLWIIMSSVIVMLTVKVIKIARSQIDHIKRLKPTDTHNGAYLISPSARQKKGWDMVRPEIRGFQKTRFDIPARFGVQFWRMFDPILRLAGSWFRLDVSGFTNLILKKKLQHCFEWFIDSLIKILTVWKI